MCIFLYLNEVMTPGVIMLLPRPIDYLIETQSQASETSFGAVGQGSPKEASNNIGYYPWL